MEKCTKRGNGVFGTLFFMMAIGVPLYITWAVTGIWSETGRMTVVTPDDVGKFFLAHQGSDIVAVVGFVVILVWGLVAPRKDD
ncbi:hypothetical protein [Acidithiobacillus ferrooxidans]|uniref:hypothetical protein n=1 Tax=Acidithiobacillus ferrooxidans TaxID=920 RepID=UPI0013D8DF3F|nr:hypothetical protein [Acidithiobacillus ferrooxidans]